MYEVTLQVTCDRAVASGFGISFGEGWARITVAGPGKESTIESCFRTVGPFLDSLYHDDDFSVRVVVAGPDAPDDTAGVHKFIQRKWSEFMSMGAIRVRAGSARAGAGSIHAEECPPKAAPGTGGAVPERAVSPKGVPFEVGAPGLARQPPSDDELVKRMTETVSAYIKTYGAAPCFSSDKPKDRDKARNYIRATTNQRVAPDTVVEQVRVRLADSGT